MGKPPSPEEMWSVDVQCRRNGGLRGSGGRPPGLRFEHPRKLPDLPTSWSDQKPSTGGRWPDGTPLGRPASGGPPSPTLQPPGSRLRVEVKHRLYSCMYQALPELPAFYRPWKPINSTLPLTCKHTLKGAILSSQV